MMISAMNNTQGTQTQFSGVRFRRLATMLTLAGFASTMVPSALHAAPRGGGSSKPKSRSNIQQPANKRGGWVDLFWDAFKPKPKPTTNNKPKPKPKPVNNKPATPSLRPTIIPINNGSLLTGNTNPLLRPNNTLVNPNLVLIPNSNALNPFGTLPPNLVIPQLALIGPNPVIKPQGLNFTVDPAALTLNIAALLANPPYGLVTRPDPNKPEIMGPFKPAEQP